MTERELTAVSGELHRLAAEGVSPWLDGVCRNLLASGRLTELVAHEGIRGVTSNVAALATAVEAGDSDYLDQLLFLSYRDVPPDAAIRALTAYDTRWACDELLPVFESTAGREGYVSVDVNPWLAHDADLVASEAGALVRAVNRPNVLAKIPATPEGLEAISECLSRKIGVHATGIFSVRRYGEVVDAYFEGLERARAAGHDLSDIVSFASLPISWLDAEVDTRLEELGTEESRALRGEAALASARLVYGMYEERLDGERWRGLAGAGARPQTVMWTATTPRRSGPCSTGYVERFVAWGTASAVSLATLGKAGHLCPLRGDTLTDAHDAGRFVWERLEELGISYRSVVRKLEDEGVEWLQTSWSLLYASVERRLRGARLFSH
ncbi:transaldolase family protein [Streptomyces sp. ISL-11]|uniref:transaldolase family protein n=1 Tax=Streptomyces sp. ISL-11 TaxID=2819174 RepID=UPI001BE7445B|nr:transaldolase family protein [Streptomyces sp. ISL-11]MBT2383739.1 transaldolase [Streptomyces sp. ISL-11]